MTLFFPSCCRVTLPASITKPKKINMALCINTATHQTTFSSARDMQSTLVQAAASTVGTQSSALPHGAAPHQTEQVCPEQPQIQVSAAWIEN